MIVIHNSTYNPRIDFIVCKQLLCTLPHVYDELKLRECFEKENGMLPYEKDIVKIKNYFQNTDITKATLKEVQELYSICTNSEIKLEGEIIPVDDIHGVEKIVQFIGKKDCQAVTLFQIMLLYGYCKYNDIPILPYHGICARTYFSLLGGDLNKAERGWRDLLYRKSKYCRRHTLEQNQICLNQLQKYKDEFLQNVGAVKLGVYGSLALGTGTEYSDVDIIIIVEKAADHKQIKYQSFTFWSDKLSIHFDFCITTNEDISKLPVGIQNTMKFI